jgi:hypothetical protein
MGFEGERAKLLRARVIISKICTKVGNNYFEGGEGVLSLVILVFVN